ncbi:MAG: methionine gamma-lyase family protein, partial [Oscillospiraceae bacterium]|nr:methionine gamma-lyase family protein [Oscillospiraceae bacterium]
MKISDIKPEVYDMAKRAEVKLSARFQEIDEIAQANTRKVMEAFQNHRVSDACFAGTTGYGYDDLGRETLDKIFADVFGTEAALVRIQFVNGTHALTAAMFALAKPGQKILAVTGMPYDTLRTAIGISGDSFGSLKFYGIDYGQVELAADGGPDYAAIAEAVRDENVAGVMIQRSRGYEDRKSLTVAEIGKIVETVKSVNPSVHVMVDNCYGEFTDTIEPGNVGADLVVGSLIKNPGGGIA